MPNRVRKVPRRPISGLTIEEVRIVADLRVMHAKVDELCQIVRALRERHSEADVNAYADTPVLSQDIEKVDEIYLWFIKLKQERNQRAAT
jgi:hypothetical protein